MFSYTYVQVDVVNSAVCCCLPKGDGFDIKGVISMYSLHRFNLKSGDVIQRNGSLCYTICPRCGNACLVGSMDWRLWRKADLLSKKGHVYVTFRQYRASLLNLIRQ
jgi:hypothetical protein